MNKSADEQEILVGLSAYRRRIGRERLLGALSAVVAMLGGFWLLAAMLYYTGTLPDWLLPVGLALSLGLPILAVVVTLARQPSLPAVAALIDARLDGRQRLVTTLELLAGGQASGLAAAQVAATAQILRTTEARAVYPLRSRGPVFGLALALLLLAGGLVVLKGAPAAFSPIEAGGLLTPSPLAGLVQSPTPESGLPPSDNPPPPPDPGAMPDAEGERPPTESQPLDPEEAARQAAESREAGAGLDRLARALDEQSITQGAADSLRQGRPGEAAGELSDVGRQSDQLSEAARQSLAESLDEAAADPATPADLSRAEREAAKALRDGDYRDVAKEMKDLADAVNRAAGEVVPQEELAKTFPTASPAQAAATPGAGGTPSAEQGQGEEGTDPGSDGQEAAPEGSGQGEPSEAGQGEPATGQGESSEGADDGTGAGQGEPGEGAGSQGEAGPGAPGQGTRVSGPPGSRPPDVAGNPFELENRPAPGQPGGGDNPAFGNAPSNGTADGSAPTSGTRATLPGESNSLPVERRPLVRRYFSPDE